jgi:hypothetical protein
MWKIVERIAFCLYAVAVGFYFLRYNNGLDTGLPGYLAALQLEWLGSADHNLTVGATMLVALAPFLVVAAIVRRLAPRDPNATRLPEGPAKLLSNGVIVAILAVSAYVFLTNEVARIDAAKVYRLNLSEAEKSPEDAEFVSAIGRIQGGYLYVLEKTRSGRQESATVYAPFTEPQWTPDQPVSYVVALGYGYGTRPSPNGKDREYSIADKDADRTAASPFEAEISADAVPLAVARAFAQDAHLKLADKLYLLKQSGFPGGKPRNKYEYVMPILPWLLPAGLPIGGALLLAGVVGLLWHRRQSAA